LAAYVVPVAPEAEPAVDPLRAALRARLPAYMVPADWVALAELPRTANGKLDRAALPAPDGAGDRGAGHRPPPGPIEEALARIWEEVLDRETVGAEDDFFALGGHSLLATQVTSRVRRSLGVELPLRALFESATVASLAAEIERRSRAGEPMGGTGL